MVKFDDRALRALQGRVSATSLRRADAYLADVVVDSENSLFRPSDWRNRMGVQRTLKEMQNVNPLRTFTGVVKESYEARCRAEQLMRRTYATELGEALRQDLWLRTTTGTPGHSTRLVQHAVAGAVNAFYGPSAHRQMALDVDRFGVTDDNLSASAQNLEAIKARLKKKLPHDDDGRIDVSDTSANADVAALDGVIDLSDVLQLEPADACDAESMLAAQEIDNWNPVGYATRHLRVSESRLVDDLPTVTALGRPTSVHALVQWGGAAAARALQRLCANEEERVTLAKEVMLEVYGENEKVPMQHVLTAAQQSDLSKLRELLDTSLRQSLPRSDDSFRRVPVGADEDPFDVRADVPAEGTEENSTFDADSSDDDTEGEDVDEELAHVVETLQELQQRLRRHREQQLQDLLQEERFASESADAADSNDATDDWLKQEDDAFFDGDTDGFGDDLDDGLSVDLDNGLSDDLDDGEVSEDDNTDGDDTGAVFAGEARVQAYLRERLESDALWDYSKLDLADFDRGVVDDLAILAMTLARRLTSSHEGARHSRAVVRLLDRTLLEAQVSTRGEVRKQLHAVRSELRRSSATRALHGIQNYHLVHPVQCPNAPLRRMPRTFMPQQRFESAMRERVLAALQRRLDARPA